MIKFIIKKVLFLFLLLLLSNWGPCNRQIQENLGELTSEKEANYKKTQEELEELLKLISQNDDPKQNRINEIIEKIKENLDFLSGKEKDILKLFYSNLEANPIQFDIENIKIHFSKQGNYDPKYYIKQFRFKENPEIEKNILLATQRILRNILLTTLQKNNPQKGSENQITLPIESSELLELRKYLLLASEEKLERLQRFQKEKLDDQWLAPENLDVSLDIQNGTLDILIKKTLFTNFIHQNIHTAFLSESNHQDHIYTLAINKDNLPNTLQNNLEKLIPLNIKDNKEIGEKVEPTYANLFHHLLNNQKQFVETIYNKIYPSGRPIVSIRDIKSTLTKATISFEITTNTQQQINENFLQEIIQNQKILAEQILKKDFSPENLVKDGNRLRLSYKNPSLAQNVRNIIEQEINNISNPVAGSTKIQQALACIEKARNSGTCDYKATLKAIHPDLTSDIDNIKTIVNYITYISFDLKTSDELLAEEVLKKDFSTEDLVKDGNRLILTYTAHTQLTDSAIYLIQKEILDNPVARVAGSKNIKQALSCIYNFRNDGPCDYKATLKAINPALISDIDNIKIVLKQHFSIRDNNNFIIFDLKTSDDLFAEEVLKRDFSKADLKIDLPNLRLSLGVGGLTRERITIIKNIPHSRVSSLVAGSKNIEQALSCIYNARNSGTCDYKATLKAINPDLTSNIIDNIEIIDTLTDKKFFTFLFFVKKTSELLAEKILNTDFSKANLVKNSNRNIIYLEYTDPNLSQDVFNIIKREINNISTPVAGSKNIKQALACINSGTCDYKAILREITPNLSTDIDNIQTVDTITYDANNNSISVIFRF